MFQPAPTLDPSALQAPSAGMEGDDDTLEPVFDRVSAIMYEISGVNLTGGKKELVRARLSKRMRDSGWESFKEYVEFVESPEGREELAQMVDILTTNKTSFFRELPHFVFLREEVLPSFSDPKQPLRIWSAGCSSGEEPYSLAILLRQVFRDIQRRDIKILATDLSRNVLAQARSGIYDEAQMEGIPPKIRSRNFLPIYDDSTGQVKYKVNDDVQGMVNLAPLNLMQSWPMRGPFEVIMCRNVMIYFDRATRERLIQRFTGLIAPGGYLMVGHSESLNGLTHDLKYIQPAVYRK